MLVTFDFSTPVNMNGSTTYMIAVCYYGPENDFANCPMVAVDTSSPSHAGNEAWKSSGTWLVDSARTSSSNVYENEALEPVSTPASSPASVSLLASRVGHCVLGAASAGCLLTTHKCVRISEGRPPGRPSTRWRRVAQSRAGQSEILQCRSLVSIRNTPFV